MQKIMLDAHQNVNNVGERCKKRKKNDALHCPLVSTNQTLVWFTMGEIDSIFPIISVFFCPFPDI